MIAPPEDATPRVEWMTRVVYAADHGSKAAGQTIDLAAGSDRDLADHRREWHLGNGAESADVMRRVWSPSDWERVDS